MPGIGTQVGPTNPRRWWSLQPDRVGTGSSLGVSAAVWSWDGGAHETSGEAASDFHTISVSLDRLETDFAVDGRPVFSGAFDPGMVALIPAGQRPWAVQKGNGRKLHVYLPDRLVADATGSSRPAVVAEPWVRRDPSATVLCGKILSALADAQTGSQLLLDAAGLELAVHAARYWSERPVETPAGATPLSRRVCKLVIDYMHDRISYDVSLADLAAVAGLSAEHFCRAFRAATGSPPHRYLLGLRMARARDYLGGTKWTISEVAAAVGYDDPSYFARLFRRSTGTAPLVYRQSLDRPLTVRSRRNYVTK